MVAEEKPANHIKSVGRKYNIHDNMDRKFNVKGYSHRTKLDLWDMKAIADIQKKKVDDRLYTMEAKQRQNDLRDFYN